MPFLWRIPIRFTVNERHFPPILIQNILYQKPARSAIPPPRKKEKSTRTSPSAFPTVLRRCRSRWDRRTAVRRIKFPIKVQLCRTFIPLPRDTYPRAPSLALRAIHLVSRAAPAVQGRGGYHPRFLRNRGCIQGGQRPPWRKLNATRASCHYPAPRRTPRGTARADPAHPACRASRPTGRARSFRARA